MTKLLYVALFVQLLSTTYTLAQEYDVIVDAGDTDRILSVISFDWPVDFPTDRASLFSSEGIPIPVQYYDEKGWFILQQLSAGDQAKYTLQQVSPVDFDGIESNLRNNGAIEFALDGAPVIQYNAEETDLPRKNIQKKFKRGGYIHPVVTPSGVTITDDYPRNHVHHHGIWAAWTKTKFDGRTPDFWNMGEESGTVRPVSLDSIWTGPVMAGTKSSHVYIDLSSKKSSRHSTTKAAAALNESWEINLFAIPTEGERPYFMFDLHVNQTTASDIPLMLPEYRYGGIGFRGNWQWNGAKNTFFLTSEGKDRSNGHATRADWCHISGYVDGNLAGVAILSHPQNFRHPQPMRIHPTEPFFNWAPSQLGDWAITSQKPYTVTYRFIVMDGEPDADMYDRLWQDFATPASVTISPR